MSSLETTKTQFKFKVKARRRAARACLSCRSRKVRCDVVWRGPPCMNCHLDENECIVPHHRPGSSLHSTYTKPRRAAAHQEAAASPPSEHASPHSGLDAHPHEEDDDDDHHHHQPTPCSLPESPRIQHGISLEPSSEVPSTDSMPLCTHQVGSGQPDDEAEVMYWDYSFLTVNNISNMAVEDVQYLEQQGCFRLPTKQILDELIQRYFLFVHPFLPLMDEGDFWDLYHASTSSEPDLERASPERTMSLLVFQSMLFASCSFVPEKVLRRIGYPTTQLARASLYRRCKLLYDRETEASPFFMSQAALLLTYWAAPMLSASRRPNSAWLSIAIQNARTAEAHCYSTPRSSTFGHSSPSALLKQQNLLKRLWWCCIIRDRILALGLRRSLQISPGQFDFSVNDTLGVSDLMGECRRSFVYNYHDKRQLAEMLEVFVELCIVLTDVLMLVCPLDDNLRLGVNMSAMDQDSIRACEISLRKWHRSTTMFHRHLIGKRAEEGNAATVLFAKLTHIYYFTARMVLSHHEILHLVLVCDPPFDHPGHRSPIADSLHKLKDAALGMAECFQGLTDLGLIHFLPISVAAFTALPLILHRLDTKLDSFQRSMLGMNPHRTKQEPLDALSNVMEVFQAQYNDVDWVSSTIRHVLNLVQLDDPTSSLRLQSHGHGAGRNTRLLSTWTDILPSRPSLYLRLAMTMDLSLAKGRLPDEVDFPFRLQGLFTGSSGPVGESLAEHLRQTMFDTRSPGQNSQIWTGDFQEGDFEAIDMLDYLMGGPRPEEVFSLRSIESLDGAASPADSPTEEIDAELGGSPGDIFLE